MENFIKAKKSFIEFIKTRRLLELLIGLYLIMSPVLLSKFNITQINYDKQTLVNITIEVSKDGETGPYKNSLSYTFLNQKNDKEKHCIQNWDNNTSASYVFYSNEDKSYVEAAGEEINIYVGKDMAKDMINF